MIILDSTKFSNEQKAIISDAIRNGISGKDLSELANPDLSVKEMKSIVTRLHK